MRDFHEDILVGHHAAGIRTVVRNMVVVQEIARNARSLRFPVAPDAHGTVMDMVAAEGHVDGGMELDAGYLGSAELLHIVDVVDMVVLYDAEYASHTSYDTCLFAVMDVAAADDVAAYLFLEPSVILAAAYGVALHLCRALHILVGEEMLVVGIEILAQ